MKNRKGPHQRTGAAAGGGRREAAAPAGSRMVIGRNTVAALLHDSPASVIKLLVAADEKGRAKELLEHAQQRGVVVEFCSQKDLTARVNSDSHQGFVAIAEARKLGSRQDLLEICSSLDNFILVALDGVTDPHNVGAILRACECFGVSGVLWSKNRSSGITPVVTKVAVGATELLNLFEVSNLADTLLALEKECGASIVCADGDAASVDLQGYTASARTVLVLGSEGEGVSDLIKRRAETIVKIPMYGQIDSLNVSQAASVMLYALKSRS